MEKPIAFIFEEVGGPQKLVRIKRLSTPQLMEPLVPTLFVALGHLHLGYTQRHWAHTIVAQYSPLRTF